MRSVVPSDLCYTSASYHILTGSCFTLICEEAADGLFHVVAP